MNREFEYWLERQLRLSLGPERGPRPHPSQARYRTASRSRISSALGTWTAAGGVIAALAAGSVTVAAATGNANPIAFGQQVVQVVQQCKDEVRGTSTSPPRGVGECVSEFARRHGEQSDDPRQKPVGPSPMPEDREGQGGARGGNGNGAEGADHGRGHPGTPASPGPPAGHEPANHGHGKQTPKPAS